MKRLTPLIAIALHLAFTSSCAKGDEGNGGPVFTHSEITLYMIAT